MISRHVGGRLSLRIRGRICITLLKKYFPEIRPPTLLKWCMFSGSLPSFEAHESVS
jgi:hypothetical protein